MEKEKSTNPAAVLAKDHQWLRPDEFTLVKVYGPSGDGYVVSFIEHVILPLSEKDDGSGNYNVLIEKRVRSTMQMSDAFFESLVNVAADVKKRSGESQTQNDAERP